MKRIQGKQRQVEATTSEAQAAALAVPAWCGVASHYAFLDGVWSGGEYRWTYNSRSQPGTGALDAITFGLKFITDDSSACGTNATSATHNYRGTTTRYTWGVRDNGNVVGWAGFGPSTLGVTYSWVDGNGLKLESDIAFNNRITNWFTGLSGTVPSNSFDLISVASHEAGHVFVLANYADSIQVMNPSLGPGVNRRVKRSGDLTGMALLY
jgi:hypothetical protein